LDFAPIFKGSPLPACHVLVEGLEENVALFIQYSTHKKPKLTAANVTKKNAIMAQEASVFVSEKTFNSLHRRQLGPSCA